MGDNVNMRGGTGNTGIVKNQIVPTGVPAVSPEVDAAVRELLQRIEQLRERLPPASAQALDSSLSDVNTDVTTSPQDRHRALMAIAGIATMVGTVGQPVVDAVNTLVGLLGVQ